MLFYRLLPEVIVPPSHLSRGRGLFKRTKEEKIEKKSIELLRKQVQDRARIRVLEARLMQAKQDQLKHQEELNQFVLGSNKLDEESNKLFEEPYKTETQP